MSPILMYLIASTAYGALALRLWQTHWRVPHSTDSGLSQAERTLLFAALSVHGLMLYRAIFDQHQMHFGFAIALSFMVWLAIALYWIESFFARLEGLLAIGLPAAAIASVLPALFPEHRTLANTGTLGFQLHFVVAMLAYSLFTLAALHALLMSAVEKNLHRGRLSPLFLGLPPLLAMETLMFRVIQIAFALLTVTLISGVMFSENLFGKALTFNHKSVFAILSWLIFAALLTGRHLRGWRGRSALRWTWTGFVSLLLAYVGTRFVYEVILVRAG